MSAAQMSPNPASPLRPARIQIKDQFYPIHAPPKTTLGKQTQEKKLEKNKEKKYSTQVEKIFLICINIFLNIIVCASNNLHGLQVMVGHQQRVIST